MGRVKRIDIPFRPNPGAQAGFLACRERHVAYRGGVGSGKTEVGARKALLAAIANPGANLIVGAPSYDTLRDVEVPKILEAFPSEIVVRHTWNPLHTILCGDRQIYYCSGAKPDSARGRECAAFWIDEAGYCPYNFWRVLLGRLRQRGGAQQALVTGTGKGRNWFSDVFPDGLADYPGTKPGHALFRGTTYDNRRNLADGFIVSLEEEYDALFLRQELLGLTVTLEGLVYGEFARDVHVIPYTVGSGRIVATVDFGFNFPAVVFFQQTLVDMPHPRPTTVPGGVIPRGSWVAFDQIVDDRVTTEALAQRIKDKGYPLDGVYGDPASEQHQSAAGASDREIFAGQGLYVIRPSGRQRYLTWGINKARGRLKNGRGVATVYYSEQMANQERKRGVVMDKERYRWDVDKEERALDKPHKDNLCDHTQDAERYLFAVDPDATGYGTTAGA